jgi:hypothetical protein
MQRFFRRPLTLTVLAVALLAGAVSAAPAWTRGLRLDFWNVPTYQRDIDRELQIQEELTAKHVVSLHRIALKNEITQDLIQGRVTLPEAVERFRRMNEGMPVIRAQLLAAYPGQSEAECRYRNVIDYARIHMSTLPAEQRTAILEQLEEAMCVSAAEGLPE